MGFKRDGNRFCQCFGLGLDGSRWALEGFMGLGARDDPSKHNWHPSKTFVSGPLSLPAAREKAGAPCVVLRPLLYNNHAR